MAMRPPNQQSGGTGTTVKAKSKASSPAGGTTSGKGKYQWATGGKVHSVSQATHDQRVQTQRTLGTQDLTAPPTGAQAVTEANSAADLQFGPQIAAAQQQQANVTPWFRDYLARVAGYATAAQKLAAPVVDQAQGYQQGAAAQMPAGLDPNSAAGQQAAQAASGRQALAQLGLDALQGNATATQDFFGGQQAAAAKDEPGAQTAAANALAGAQSQHGAAVNSYLTTARQNAQNYAIARGTLNLNTGKAAADTDLSRGVDPVTGQPLPAKPEAPYSSGAFAGMTPTQVRGLSTAQRKTYVDDYNDVTHPPKAPKAGGLTPAQQQAADKAAAKHKDDVHAATGGVQNTIADIIGAWNSNVGKQTDDTTQPKDPKTGQYPPRPLTPDDIKAILGQNKAWTPQLIHIALLRRAGKPLDQASIDYLHNTNPNVRIPHDWLPTAGGNKAPKAPANPFASTNPLVTTHP